MIQILLLLLSLSPARAENLSWSPARDVSLAVAGGGIWVATEVLKPALAPSACRWCDDNALDRPLRDAALWSDTATANSLSNWSGFVFAPVIAVGGVAAAGLGEGNLAPDAVIVFQSAALSGLVTQAVKYTAGRERPFVHALPESQKSIAEKPADNNLSFFSGHTSLAFSLAVSSGTVSSLRGYRAAPWIWGAGLAVATATGYFRMAADKHYFTDVLVGAAVGSAIGFVVPYSLHGSRDTTVSAAPGFVQFAFAF